MSEQEYTNLRSRLLKEKAVLESELNAQGKAIEEWVELSEKTFNFARYARIWFEKGDIETKRAIFACIGSNLVLKNQQVAILLRKPFQFIFDGLPNAQEELQRLEPLIFASNQRELASFAQKFPVLSG